MNDKELLELAAKACQPEIDALQARIAQLEQESSETLAQEPVAYRVDYPNADGVGMGRFFGHDSVRRMKSNLDSARIAGIDSNVTSLYAAPLPPAVPEGMQLDVEAIMWQAQVFASAWSLVGGRFDLGDGMEGAEREKQVLRKMLTTAKGEAACGNVRAAVSTVKCREIMKC